MLPTIIDLRPDRNLLLDDFEGYKLSLQPTPLIKQELPVRPDRVKSSKFSFLHAQLFGLQNHLVADKFSPNSAYFIDESFMVKKIQYDEVTGKMKLLQDVFKTTISRLRNTKSDYNFSFLFVSEFMVVLSDGLGCLKIIDTGDRTKNAEWKCVSSLEPLLNRGFILMDARFEITNGERQIHCIVLEIEEDENESHLCKLHWLSLLKKDSSQWEEFERKELIGKHIPSYCHLETKSKSLILASDSPFKFIGETPMSKLSESSAVIADLLLLRWQQTDEDLTIDFDIKDSDKESFSVVSTHETLTITHCGEKKFDQKLYGKIDPTLTTWTLQSSKLQIILMKLDVVNTWPELYFGSPEEGLETMPIAEKPVCTLESELEECDFGVDGIETDYNIERFAGDTKKMTHRISLGATGPLFSISVRTNEPPAIVLRYDQDACVFLQTNSNNVQDSSKWNLRHIGTVHAFGYIQASKQQKKFLTCSPDMEYGIICESERHVYIYKHNDSWSSGLHNRKGRQVKIGQQKLIQLEGTGEVLGISAENTVTLLLTEKYVICMKLQVKD